MGEFNTLSAVKQRVDKVRSARVLRDKIFLSSNHLHYWLVTTILKEKSQSGLNKKSHHHYVVALAMQGCFVSSGCTELPLVCQVRHNYLISS